MSSECVNTASAAQTMSEEDTAKVPAAVSSSAWDAPEFNATFRELKLSLRLPLAMSPMSYADRWWLANVFYTRVDKPFEIVSLFAKWPRFVRLVHFEPIIAILFYQLEQTSVYALSALAVALYSLGVANITFSVSQFLLLPLALILRYLLFQLFWTVYALLLDSYAVYHLATDPENLVGEEHRKREAETRRERDGQIASEREGENGREREEEAETQPVYPKIVAHTMNDGFEMTIGKALWTSKWPMALIQFNIVSLLSVATFGSVFAARALYDLLPLVFEGLLRRSPTLSQDREPFPRLLVASPLSVSFKSAQSDNFVRVLWLYALPRISVANILDYWLLTYIFIGFSAPLFVFLNCLVECCLSCRELAHRIR